MKRVDRGSARASATPETDAQIARGDWNPLWNTLRQWDPQFMEAYLAFRNVPHRHGPLSPKFKELILIAVNAATTHLYAPGIRRHVQNALKHGATREEILEVLELVTVLGIHACNMGVPILAEELAAQRASVEAGAPARPPRRARARKPGAG